MTVPALALKRIGQDDYAVMAGSRTAGRIMAKPKAGGEAIWFWTITGPHTPASLQPSNGEVETLEAAKSAYRSKTQAIFELAKSERREVYWVGDPPPEWHLERMASQNPAIAP